MDSAFWLGNLQRILLYSTPLILATCGEIITERSGILNLGMEGLIALGALFSFAAAFITGNPWLGVLAALVGGAVFAFLHAFVSVNLRSNQVVSGLALTMLGTGVTGLFGNPFLGKHAVRLSGSPLPFFPVDVFFYFALVAAAGLWFVLGHTSLGVKIRAAGENPKAADAQGVKVNWIRTACVVVGGALAGLAGSQIALSYLTSWVEVPAGGRGWIAITLTIFALWKPWRAVLGALLFGTVFVFQYFLQSLGVPASLLEMFPYLVTLLALVALGFSKNKRSMLAPAMLGEAFRRGER